MKTKIISALLTLLPSFAAATPYHYSVQSTPTLAAHINYYQPGEQQSFRADDVFYDLVLDPDIKRLSFTGLFTGWQVSMPGDFAPHPDTVSLDLDDHWNPVVGERESASSNFFDPTTGEFATPWASGFLDIDGEIVQAAAMYYGIQSAFGDGALQVFSVIKAQHSGLSMEFMAQAPFRYDGAEVVHNPEPVTAALLLAGLFPLAYRRRM